MSYKCKNTNCSQFDRLLNPGGRIIYQEGKSFFTGSICKSCSRPMEHIPNEMGDFKNIKNDSDGRNL